MKLSKTRIISYLLLIVILAGLYGCSRSSEVTSSDDSVTVSSLAQAVMKSKAYPDPMNNDTKEALSVFGIDSSSLVDYCYYSSSNSDSAAECVIFEAASMESASTILEAFKAHQSSQVIEFEQKLPSEVEKINDAIIASYGNYVFYMVSDAPSTVKKVLRNEGIDLG